MKIRLFLTATVLSVAAVLPASAQSLAAQFNGNSIRISGLKPRKSAAVVVVSRTLEGYMDSITEISNSFSDDDGDGAISIPMPKGIPPRTVVVAVDELTGDYVISTPREPSRQPAADDAAIRRDKDGNAIEFHRPAQFVDMLLVRPGAGSWFSSANGKAHVNADGSGETGVVLTFASMKGHAPAPDRLVANDVCIAVDEDTLEAVVLRERK